MFYKNLEAKSKTPLFMQIYTRIKNGIESGELKSGEKLPSKRTLAEKLGVSVITVENAYLQLVSEGYIFSRSGSGYYVEKINEEKTGENFSLSYDSERLKKETIYDFSSVGVDTTAFPFSVWSHLTREVLSGNSEKLLRSCDGRGDEVLRKEIADYLKKYRDITVNPENIIVGAGSEYLTGLIVQLLGRDAAYGVENPGYDKTYKIFAVNSSRVFPILTDSGGASVKAVSGFGINVLHVTPSHHFPLGTVMPVSRRLELMEWADLDDDRYIVEDEYDSEFRYVGKPVPALKSIDKNGKVIYLYTFTKILTPSVRVGFMVLPDELMKKFRAKLGFYSCTVPVLEQLVLAKFIGGGFFERHVNRMKKIYKTKRDFLLKKFEESDINKIINVSGTEAGTHLVVKVNNGDDEETLIVKAEKEGVRVRGLKSFYSFPTENIPQNTVVISYSGMTIKDIEEGVKLLEKAWKTKSEE